MKQLLVRLIVMATSLRPFAGRRVIWEVIKEFAPYAAIELILPGGTLIAVLCWLYRKKHAAGREWLSLSRPALRADSVRPA
jgi:hypothetical protein